MPTLPAYNTPKVQAEALRPAEQQGLGAGAFGAVRGQQTSQLGAGLQGLANAAATAAALDKDRDDATQLFDAETALKTNYITWAAEQKKTRTRENAGGVAKDSQEWFAKASEEIGAKLPNPRVQQMFRQSAGRLSTSSFADFTEFENKQKDDAFVASVQAGVTSAINTAAANARPDDIVIGIADIKSKNAAFAARKGLSAEELNNLNGKDITTLHKQVIQTLSVRAPSEAQGYYDKVRDQIDGSQRAEIEHTLKTVAAAAEGEATADKTWGKMGPKGDIAPVELDKMESAIREELKGKPESIKAAISGLRERAAAHNSSQAERVAGATNTVMDVYAKTKSLAAMQRMPEWQALPASQRVKIEEHITNVQTAQLNRANALDARADAADARTQRKLQRDNFGAYLVYSNPTTLANMSEAQVQSLLPSLGNELTGHLMEKRRALGSATTKQTAQIDADDFKAVASEMGLKPYAAKHSDDERAVLGQLQYRTEQLIDEAQRNKKAPLDRQEKQAIVRREMAATVLVNPGWFSSSEQKPVILLTPEEKAKVVIPANDRKLIADGMAQQYARTKRKEFEPTEANLRNWYLNAYSPAAGLIPDAK